MSVNVRGNRFGPLDDSSSHQSLLRVQVCRRLVDQVNVGWFPQTQSESDSLQLTTRQVLHLREDEQVSQALTNEFMWGNTADLIFFPADIRGSNRMNPTDLTFPLAPPSGWCKKRGTSYILIYDALYLHWLHDVSDELRVSVGVSDLVVQQSSDTALHTHKCHIC